MEEEVGWLNYEAIVAQVPFLIRLLVLVKQVGECELLGPLPSFYTLSEVLLQLNIVLHVQLFEVVQSKTNLQPVGLINVIQLFVT